MRITQALARAVAVGRHRTATIEGERVRNWGEVEGRVSRIAYGLRAHNVQPGDRVAILAHNCDLFFESYFAIPWAGAVMVPLNTRLAQSELAFQLQDAGVKLLLFGREFEGVAQALVADSAVALAIGLDGPSTLTGSSLEGFATAKDELPEAQQEDSELAAIFYTGGTTGLPKGVMLSHGNMHAIATNVLMSIPFDEDCVSFHAAPMFHLADICTISATMAAGTHVFRRSFDAVDMIEAISKHRVTHCLTVPAIIERMTKVADNRFDLSSLRILGYGGSSITAASIEEARRRFPHVGFVQGFGQTEFAAATVLSVRDHSVSSDPAKLRSCGKVCFGYEIKIVDEEGRECPRGEIGEIIGRGGNVMMGYWNRPEETAEVLRDGWIHTRDAGYMDDDGYIYLTDRLKDMIVSGAENIYSIEVENAMSWHPAIEEAAVIGVPDSVWGERVHAVVVLKDDAEPIDIKMLAAFCKLRIASYKTPKSMEIRTHPLPRNAAGKILKTVLRAEYLKASGTFE